MGQTNIIMQCVKHPRNAYINRYGEFATPGNETLSPYFAVLTLLR